jgi:hypothetical protein
MEGKSGTTEKQMESPEQTTVESFTKKNMMRPGDGRS